MATRRTQEFLDGNHVRYALIRHSPASSASQVAESVHISGQNLAKVVIVVIQGRLAMAVVTATRDVDFIRLQRIIGLNNVRLAHESELADRFEGCQLGAAPPFGNLFGVDTFVDARLVQQSHIAFNAGTHNDVIVTSSDDYIRLTRPRVAHIAAEPIHEQVPAFSI
jgi:Ala-tRNA(Pro) deacylase